MKLSLITLLIAAWVGAMFWCLIIAFDAAHPSPTKYHMGPNLDMTNEQYRRVLQGFVRDHGTHQWFKLYAAEHENGCKLAPDSTVTDVTFVGCRQPLVGGLPDLTE